jgi:tryptophanyl-tRNA synthetase
VNRFIEADKAEVMAILKRGTLHAREVAGATLAEVKGAMGLTYFG